MLELVFLCLLVLAETQSLQGSEGQSCIRGDGLPGRCAEFSKCLARGGSFENVGRIKPCPFGSYSQIFVCCRPNFRKIAEKKCQEWTTGGGTGISATDVIHLHIAGGENVKPGEFPHMVSLLKKPNDHFCGAVLISSLYALTAAHCITGPVNDIEARMGAHDISNPNEGDTQRVNVVEVLFPDGYISPVRYHDIAILRLGREITITRRVRPICLPYEPNVYLTTVTVSGWGYRTGVSSLISDILQKADLRYDDQAKCNERLSENMVRRVFQDVYPSGVTNTIICASERGRDACKGDSGGPLIRRQEGTSGILVGIVSQGIGCPSTSPGTYTRVESYLEWIVNTVWPNESL